MEPASQEANPPSALPKKTNKRIKKLPPSKKKVPDTVFFEEESIFREHPSLQEPQPPHPFSGQIPHPSQALPQHIEEKLLPPPAEGSEEGLPPQQLNDYQICKNLMRAVINIRLDYEQAKKIVAVMQVLRKRPLHQTKMPAKKPARRGKPAPKEEKKVEEEHQEGGYHHQQPPAPAPPAPREA